MMNSMNLYSEVLLLTGIILKYLKQTRKQFSKRKFVYSTRIYLVEGACRWGFHRLQQIFTGSIFFPVDKTLLSEEQNKSSPFGKRTKDKFSWM
jgi:hypothetical protein